MRWKIRVSFSPHWIPTIGVMFLFPGLASACVLSFVAWSAVAEWVYWGSMTLAVTSTWAETFFVKEVKP